MKKNYGYRVILDLGVRTKPGSGSGTFQKKSDPDPSFKQVQFRNKKLIYRTFAILNKIALSLDFKFSNKN